MTKIQFIDLKAQYKALKPSIDARIQKVLDHGQYIMGPEVTELEAQLAKFAGVRHCISASSGTCTLLIAMMALGIGQGDEVITTPFTFIATGEMIALLESHGLIYVECRSAGGMKSSRGVVSRVSCAPVVNASTLVL